MKKQESKRYVTSMILHTGHLYANILALTKILGITFTEAKSIAKCKPSEELHFVPYLEIKSDLSTDEILDELDEYEIKPTIINQ